MRKSTCYCEEGGLNGENEKAAEENSSEEKQKISWSSARAIHRSALPSIPLISAHSPSYFSGLLGSSYGQGGFEPEFGSNTQEVQSSCGIALCSSCSCSGLRYKGLLALVRV